MTTTRCVAFHWRNMHFSTPVYFPTLLYDSLYFLPLLADLRCLLRLCLCPELSFLHWLMIGLQYSCPMSPPFHGQAAEWQQVWCFFSIEPWVDLLPLNNRHCSQREVAVSLLLSAENIYVGIKPQEFWSSKQINRIDDMIEKINPYAVALYDFFLKSFADNTCFPHIAVNCKASTDTVCAWTADLYPFEPQKGFIVFHTHNTPSGCMTTLRNNGGRQKHILRWMVIKKEAIVSGLL